MSSDGLTLAISNHYVDQIVVYAYDMVGGAWIKRGDTITGPENSWFGSVISMSSDGQTIAGGGYYWDNGKGLVQVWRFDGSKWVRLGNTLYGTNDWDQFGRSIALLESENGIDLLIGSEENSNGSRGSARVVQFDGIQWNQRGSTLTGDNDSDGLASMPDSVAISDNGNMIAIGAYHGKYVKCLRWDGNDWEMIGTDLKSLFMWFGASVELSTGNNGNFILAIGSPSTAVYFFKLNGSTWSTMSDSVQDSSSEYIGYEISLSDDGNTVITATDSAAVVFDYDGQNWNQRGSVLNVDGDPFGREWATTEIIVDISGDGNRVVVGLPDDDDGYVHGDNIGQVHCFEWRR